MTNPLARISQALRGGKVSPVEFAFDSLTRLVTRERDVVREALKSLSPNEVQLLTDYSRSYFAENETVPPEFYVVAQNDPVSVELKRRELIEPCKMLLEEIEARAAELRSDGSS